MHYAPHALLNCVAWFSLLCCYGHAAKGVAPSEVLSHFAHTVGTVLVPTLANELHSSRSNRSAAQGDGAIRRQVSPQDGLDADNPSPVNRPTGGLPGRFAGQGFPYQYERTYSYRYPPYTQQISQSFYPGGAFANGLPLDPRIFQGHIGGHQLAPIQPEIPKPLNSNINPNGNNNLKENGNNNVNTIQNLDSNVDSKSSAQSRPPFDGGDFGAGPIGPGGPGLDPTGGNLRVNNRFSGIDYERIRENYYNDPPINQQRAGYFGSSFNEIPFSGGPPYRSPLAERYSNLDYSGVGGGRAGGPASELRSGNGIGGIGDPYFGSFLPGPYQSQLNYNSLPGSGSPGSPRNGGPPFDGFDRASNLRSPFNNLQYPIGAFNFYPGGGAGGAGPDFNEGDSTLRASSSKETVSETSDEGSQDNRDRESLERLEDAGERNDGEQKVRFVSTNGKHLNEESKSRANGQA